MRHFTALLLLISFFSQAQKVYNDNIENRHPLIVNHEPYISHTEECTLQKECLNFQLTDQCLIFHNDQWFEFKTAESGDYYLNIRNQDCRDIRGIQAVVLKGEPCKAETYELIACQSNGHQDDVSIKLTQLEKETAYLLIIDGYLHDYCYFDIDISNTPPSFFPRLTEKSHYDSLESNDPEVTLSWLMELQDAEDILEYRILRRFQNERKSEIIEIIPALRNARGVPFLNYSTSDSVTEKGNYYYKVVGLNQDSSQLLILDMFYHFKSRLYSSNPADNYLNVSIPKAKRGSLIKITLSSQKPEIILESKELHYDKLFTTFKWDITKYRERGLSKYSIQFENYETGELSHQKYEVIPLPLKERKSALY